MSQQYKTNIQKPTSFLHSGSEISKMEITEVILFKIAGNTVCSCFNGRTPKLHTKTDKTLLREIQEVLNPQEENLTVAHDVHCPQTDLTDQSESRLQPTALQKLATDPEVYPETNTT